MCRRIGHGSDVRRFAEGDFIAWGGVRIAHR
ncbi:2-C-methyl-D-erythritol 2,4-cyclodiphosphate synthase, partial [Pseudomonas syringae pv. tagetis]